MQRKKQDNHRLTLKSAADKPTFTVNYAFQISSAYNINRDTCVYIKNQIPYKRR